MMLEKHMGKQHWKITSENKVGKGRRKMTVENDCRKRTSENDVGK
jgi:hypothetical protein